MNRHCYQQVKALWILTLLLTCVITAQAQNEVPHFFRLTYNDGLSDNKVNCIIKSHEGYIWAGTPQGLNRYDGFRIRVFHASPNNIHTLPDNNILNLYEDAEGQLWANTPAGHCRFSPKTEQVNRNTDQWLHQHQGSGIGLNRTWEYAQMLGGTIKVEDNKSRGALFTITLPAKDLKAEGEGYAQALDNDNTVPAAILAKSTGAANENRRQQRSTLLLVDDNTDFLGFLSEELQANYRILKAENGKQALEVIHHDMPDLVITDVMMPVMDGNELCRKIKGSDKTHHLPVMVLTARLADENEIESRECGADDYIKKPFSMDLFRLHIDQLLKQGRIVDNGKVDPKISKTAITTQDEAFIDKATHYIEEHLCDSELTVEQMSDDLAMSRVQLYRRIVSITGKTPSELIRLVRLRHAERLVVQSQLSISEISYMVGFSSTRYFSRCFKELYGYLPSRYKKNAE